MEAGQAAIHYIIRSGSMVGRGQKITYNFVKRLDASLRSFWLLAIEIRD
jgi:hypothetical protein